MTLKLANFSTALLAAPISPADETLTITSGSEVNFPTLAAGDWFPVVVVDNLANREVMRCTARTTNVLTVTRGRENTAAMAFSAGARVDARFTTAALNELLQKTVPISVSEKLTLTGNTTNGRVRFNGSGEVGLEFEDATLFFGVDSTAKKFIWNNKADASGTNVASMDATGKLALNSKTVPTGGYSSLYAGEVSLSVINFNAHHDTVSNRREHLAAGWAGYFYLDVTSGQVTLARSNASRAANAALEPASALVYWTDNNYARFPSRVYASAAFLDTNGNITGSLWQDFSASNHTDAYSAIANRIEERCSAYRDSTVTSTRMAGLVQVEAGGSPNTIWREYGGYVLTGIRRSSGDGYEFRWRQPQRYIANLGWAAAFDF